jgi:hypothetical protein
MALSKVGGNQIDTVSGDLTVDTNTLVVDSANNKVGIGTTSPTYQTTVYGSSQSTVEIESGSDTGESRLYFTDPTTTGVGTVEYHHNGNTMRFQANSAERMRITGDGQGGVAIGGTDPDPTSDGTSTRAFLAVQGSGNRGCLALGTSSNSGGDVAALRFNNGSNVIASIGCDTDSGSTTAGIMNFFTNGTQRYKIDSGGNHMFNKTAVGDSTAGLDIRSDGRTTVCRPTGQPLNVSRVNDDGTLIQFIAQGTEEGQIVVSGTTVSYNGGHLSRWSQLTDGTKDTSIVKGTVMTNLDQMAVWSYAEGVYTIDDVLPDGVSVGDVRPAYTEDNEQLNCMAVSSVEGDANVAGVFVNWDNDDDDFNDMNVAMTGDMVIRIASGTTVARGDLLMSAGDGTAKPQGDDIVRSKTIAKVTSTTVSHTYDDGSYLVPCVLMAC